MTAQRRASARPRRCPAASRRWRASRRRAAARAADRRAARRAAVPPAVRRHRAAPSPPRTWRSGCRGPRARSSAMVALTRSGSQRFEDRREVGVDGELDALGALLAVAQPADGGALAPAHRAVRAAQPHQHQRLVAHGGHRELVGADGGQLQEERLDLFDAHAGGSGRRSGGGHGSSGAVSPCAHGLTAGSRGPRARRPPVARRWRGARRRAARRAETAGIARARSSEISGGVEGSCAPAMISVGQRDEPRGRPQIHVADRGAAAGIAGRGVGDQGLADGTDRLRMPGGEVRREPAAHRGLGDRGHAVAVHRLDALLPPRRAGP